MASATPAPNAAPAPQQQSVSGTVGNTPIDFIDLLVHELRTPLTPLLMLSHMLIEDPTLPPHLRDQVEMMRANVEQQAAMIDDLLDMSRCSKNTLRLSLDHLDISKLVGEVVDACRILATDHRIDLHFSAAASPTITMTGDPLRLSRAIKHLINNAIVHGKVSPIDIAITAATDAAVISIVDHGRGLEPAELTKLQNTDPLAALHQTPGSSQRLGFGWPVARAIINAHSGNLTVSSSGRGTGVSVTTSLPKNQP